MRNVLFSVLLSLYFGSAVAQPMSIDSLKKCVTTDSAECNAKLKEAQNYCEKLSKEDKKKAQNDPFCESLLELQWGAIL